MMHDVRNRDVCENCLVRIFYIYFYCLLLFVELKLALELKNIQTADNDGRSRQEKQHDKTITIKMLIKNHHTYQYRDGMAMFPN